MQIEEMMQQLSLNLDENQLYTLTAQVRRVSDPTVSGIAPAIEVVEYRTAIMED